MLKEKKICPECGSSMKRTIYSGDWIQILCPRCKLEIAVKRKNEHRWKELLLEAKKQRMKKRVLESNRLDQYEVTHCSCKKCISYCEKHPGWFRPKEMPRLAESLEMPLLEVFKKYLIADYWVGKSSVYVLSPVKDFGRMKSGPEVEMLYIQKEHNKFMGRRSCDKAGGYASWGYAFIHAPCIFLKDNKCSIYEARPFECAVAWHKDDEKIKFMRELIMKEWKKSKLIKKLMKEL